METNKFEQDIRKKLADREIIPSGSAWERLSLSLDKQEEVQKKKQTFIYLGYAASILILVSLFLFMNKESNNEVIINKDQELVIEEMNVLNFDTKKLKTVIKETKTLTAKTSLDQMKRRKKEITKRVELKKKDNLEFVDTKKVIDRINEKKEVVVVNDKNDNKLLKKDDKREKSRIFVDGNALLYSVTHSEIEVRKYYEKYRISRAEILKTIELELKKENLNINPNTLLAEVEMDLNEESFQNSFYQFIKKRVSDVASAIANRNN